MHNLKSITFKRKYRCFDAGYSIEFKAATILVGDQGCGKTTLLKELINPENIEVDCPERTSVRKLDTEKDNPRTREFDRDKSYGPQIAIRWCSHGQAIKAMLKSAANWHGEIILIDEPEAGLSIKSQYEIACFLKEVAAKNQLICATHSPIIMDTFKEVYSLEHCEWMSAERFIFDECGFHFREQCLT